jgi:hypothetical protein
MFHYYYYFGGFSTTWAMHASSPEHSFLRVYLMTRDVSEVRGCGVKNSNSHAP